MYSIKFAAKLVKINRLCKNKVEKLRLFMVLSIYYPTFRIPIDSLLAKTEQAVRQHHGVCWESKSHAMAIVGIAHDDEGNPYFIMKNSWGTGGPYKGLAYLSYSKFKKTTLAIEMTKEADQN